MLTPLPLSPWKQHVENWIGCQRCAYHEARKNVVLARGKIPADVAFIGEAPGEHEDVWGQPFVGPSGKLLDRIVEDAIRLAAMRPENVRVVFGNIIACVPRDLDPESDNYLGKTTEPEPLCIEACKPRLIEFIRMVRPRLIVCVGKLSGKFMPSSPELGAGEWMGEGLLRYADILHPAYILRSNVAMQSLSIQRCVVTVSQALEEVYSSR